MEGPATSSDAKTLAVRATLSDAPSRPPHRYVEPAKIFDDVAAVAWREDPSSVFFGDPGSVTVAHHDIVDRLELCHVLSGCKITAAAVGRVQRRAPRRRQTRGRGRGRRRRRRGRRRGRGFDAGRADAQASHRGRGVDGDPPGPVRGERATGDARPRLRRRRRTSHPTASRRRARLCFTAS